MGRGRPCTPLLDLIPDIGTACSTPSPLFGEHPEPPPSRKGMSQTLVLTYLVVFLANPTAGPLYDTFTSLCPSVK